MAMTKGVACSVALPMVDAADPANLKSGLAPTCLISYDGDGGFAALTNAPVENGATGIYVLSLTAAEMNHDTITVRAHAVGACDQVLTLVTDPPELSILTRIEALISTTPITVRSPLAKDFTLTIYQGDSYPEERNRAIEIPIADPAHLLALDTADMWLRSTEFSWLATHVYSIDTGWRILYEPTVVETQALQRNHERYKVIADYGGTGDDVSTVLEGQFVLSPDIPPVP